MGAGEASAADNRKPQSVAYVVGQAPTQELDKLCLSEIARFKRPKDYVFVEALPKNNYGKILKTDLRERDKERAMVRASGGR